MQNTFLHISFLSYYVFLALLQNRLDAVPRSKNYSLQKQSIAAAFFSNKSLSEISANRTTCSWLRGYKFQNEICRRTKGFSDVLRNSRNLAVQHCEEQFRFDRWNCTFKKSVFRKIYRETAFLHAMSGATIMYATAKACSEKKLKNCKCSAEERTPEEAKNEWRWRGCGDNARQARRIAKRFLQLGQKGDGPRNVLNYNSLVGMEIVAESETKVCTCHGVSASCAFKTCYKKLQPFKKIAEILKQRYHGAIQLSPGNSVKQTVGRSRGNLLYLAKSPNLCSSTGGRRCKNAENCATLCCGRGFSTNKFLVQKRCRCRWHKCCMDVECDTCEEINEEYVCK